MSAWSVTAAASSAVPRARALAQPVWKPTSTVRYMWYPHKTMTSNSRVNGIITKRGLPMWKARASVNYNAQHGVSTGLSDNVIIGMAYNPTPGQTWSYAGPADS
ncbi:hypothetical protein DIPPA_04887 [Diplonema papillatum]|nr:hypothetical protein DIPPA_04887 [Diplonema papillatum]